MMKNPLYVIGFLAAVLLAGFIGFAAASDWMPPQEPSAEQAAVRVDVDLTGTAQAQPQETENPLEKTRETEPEEIPSDVDIEVEIVRRETEQGTPLRALIYHSHTYEAYEPDFDFQYKATERWRTADNAYNIVRVGAEIARILEEEYGMLVTHDTTAFEPPWLDSAYQRSLEAIENYTAKGETFDLYLDIHRDAYIEGRFAENFVEVEGERVARLMFLIGKGTGTFGGQEFAQKPDWEQNIARAEIITDAINAAAENLCRPVSTKSSRFNQHVSTGALLIEVGNNMNTLDEALRAARYLARAIGETAGGTMAVIQHPVDEE